jgi:Domain of unknown function (DUF4258)
MTDQAFALTTHAATAIAERGIEIDWVARTIRQPERIETDRWDAALKHALLRIAERGDRVLRVVYNDSTRPLRVVTAYFDRGQREPQ